MKKLILTAMMSLGMLTLAASDFDRHFSAGTLRIDLNHCGDASTESYFLDKIVKEPYWGGSKVYLIDTLGYGNQHLRVYDAATDSLIYSRGYCTLFNEWQATDEARSVRKSYAESVVMPYPKDKVRVEIIARDKRQRESRIFEMTVDPSDYLIIEPRQRYETFDVIYSGPSEKTIDMAILSEGYTADQKELFENDCRQFAEAILSFSPFKENRRRFNFRAVWVPSEESGVSMPGEGYWRNTALGAKFYTFYSERYQIVDDFQRVRDVAAAVPYDYIYILTSSQKYGGGGIYNFYGISSTADPSNHIKVYVHEFAHLFMGLADEYVGGAEEGMYDLDSEPWEENITTLKEFDRKQWSRMIDDKTPIPTPPTSRYENTLGVFEGGGYNEKGIYRPAMKCLMNSFAGVEEFCPVCKMSLEKTIRTLAR